MTQTEPLLVVVDYAQLTDTSVDLSREIDEAFGPSGLGIISVRNVPNFKSLRRNLLPLAARFWRLPDEVKHQYEDADSCFNVGWSCGKETLEDGTPDTRKGSFFANPLEDVPTRDPELLQQFPSYTRPNLWPTKELPELEPAFKELGRLIYDVGILISKHCDKYVANAGVGNPSSSLQDVIERSNCTKGRLLCYVPSGSEKVGQSLPASPTRWCGWHTDHGCLTGLTPGYYLEGDDIGTEIDCPDLTAGLYIKTRSGRTVGVKIDQDHLAFQVGEALQVISGGALQATPHCVASPGPEHAFNLTRCTLAVFMQPTWNERLDCPSEVEAEAVGVAAWKPGMSFGEFSETRFDSYYGRK